MTVLDRCVGGQTKNQHGKASAKRALLNFNYYNEEIFHAEGRRYCLTLFSDQINFLSVISALHTTVRSQELRD